MKYNRKIKNKNTGYFIVGKRIFASLRNAEFYCNKKGLDVNKCIISKSQDALENAKDISDSVLPVLYDIKENIQRLYKKQFKEFEIAAEECRESKHNFFQGLEKEYMNRSHGVLKGIKMAMSIIREQINVHENIKNIHK